MSVSQSNKGRMPSGYQSCTLMPPSLFTHCLASNRLIQPFQWLTLISPKNSCLKQSHQPSGTRAESAWSEWRHQPKSFQSEGFWDLGKELCSCTTVTLASNFSPKPTFCISLKCVTEKICIKPTELISLGDVLAIPSKTTFPHVPVKIFSEKGLYDLSGD